MPTQIEWTDESWNPVTGCSPVSAACDHCYARPMAERLRAMGQPGYKDGFAVTLHPTKLDYPHHWKKARRVFVCSMGDLFHPEVPFQYIDQIFAVMADANRHTYQILTKRPERMLEYLSGPRDSARKVFSLAKDIGGKFDHDPYWPLDNVHVGVTAENKEMADARIPILLKCPAEIRFVSAEPLLGPIDLMPYLKIVRPCLSWVICGGENGPGARPMHPDWARSLRDQCQSWTMPLFFKGWGEYGATAYNMTSGEPVFKMFDSFQQWVNKASSWLGYRSAAARARTVCVDMSGRILKNGGDFQSASYPVAIMELMGKAKSGRLLDGRILDEFPS